MRLRISLSVPQRERDRLIYISIFPVILNLKMLWLLVLFFSVSVRSSFFFVLMKTVLPQFWNNKSTRQFTNIFFCNTQAFISLCHSLPADYFTLHWALYVQDWILTWDAVASFAVHVIYCLVDYSMTLVRSPFKEPTVKKHHLVNMLQYSFSTEI